MNIRKNKPLKIAAIFVGSVLMIGILVVVIALYQMKLDYNHCSSYAEEQAALTATSTAAEDKSIQYNFYNQKCLEEQGRSAF